MHWAGGGGGGGGGGERTLHFDVSIIAEGLVFSAVCSCQVP